MLFPEAHRLELAGSMMLEADVDPTLRPTELTIAQFSALADAYANLCAQEPGLLNYEFREELRLKKLARHGLLTDLSPGTLVDTLPPSPQQEPC